MHATMQETLISSQATISDTLSFLRFHKEIDNLQVISNPFYRRSKMASRDQSYRVGETKGRAEVYMEVF